MPRTSLLLRHRARSVLILCPASLQLKWQEEMREKFGLEFRIVNTELLRTLRRRRGLHVNPWTHFPRLVASIDWIKADRPMALLREILPPTPSLPRRFDLLIVDEVHNVAPARSGETYATDTLRTAAVRTLAPHCEHKLFLSATPHNGYPNSFSALLELLDPQRFARGVAPDREQLGSVMVRRLKSEIVDEAGRHVFPRRVVEPLEVAYPDDEHAALEAYAASRARRLDRHGEGGRTAGDFVLMLLKKRLFSSPGAFEATLEAHRHTVERRAAGVVADEREQEEAETEALRTALRFGDAITAEERELLERLEAFAARAARREDAKCERLLDWLEGELRPPVVAALAAAGERGVAAELVLETAIDSGGS